MLALLAELTHEIIENSEWMIQLYRNNSGTSGLYEGDSAQNIIGDLISALFGWYVTALLHWVGYPWIVVIWTIISEVKNDIYQYITYSCVLIPMSITYNDSFQSRLY